LAEARTLTLAEVAGVRFDCALGGISERVKAS
jgi:hypothetical protein